VPLNVRTLDVGLVRAHDEVLSKHHSDEKRQVDRQQPDPDRDGPSNRRCPARNVGPRDVCVDAAGVMRADSMQGITAAQHHADLDCDRDVDEVQSRQDAVHVQELGADADA
jgi:hypothetical protein